jgi:hypothetical protein
MGEGVFLLNGGQSFVFDSRSIRVRSTAPGMGCFSAPKCTVADVARTCSGTKHHETLDLATAATEERKPSHGSTLGVSQQKPGCEHSGRFQITSEHSTTRHCRNRGAACTERELWQMELWTTAAVEAHGVLGLIIGGNQSWESGNRLKDGDTAVSSLFASQEETGQIEST